MQISMALDIIENILLKIEKQNANERLQSYSVIVAILSGIDERVAQNKALYEDSKLYLLLCLEALCGLDDGKGYDDSQQIDLALSKIDKMRSVLE